MKTIDITDKVAFEDNDGECLPLISCVCGHVWEAWTFSIGADEDYPTECPFCKRKLFFSFKIRVYEVKE